MTHVFLTGWLPDTDDTYTVDYAELAHQLGATPPRLTRTITRLVAFRFAAIDPHDTTTLAAVRRVPTLNAGQLARLAEHCPTLAAHHHDELLHTAA